MHRSTRFFSISWIALSITATGCGSSTALQQAATSISPEQNPSLPTGAPPALYAPEPPRVLQGWPFPEAFPRTSGFGRLAGGAFFWSSFVYDDHGALGAPVGLTPIVLSPQIGTYLYPPGVDNPAVWLPNVTSVNGSLNGADIAAAAIGLDGDDVWFRVDWETLVDPNFPVAMWAFDTDDNPATGVAAWPAGAGVTSPGIEQWLVMSGNRAWLLRTDGSSMPVSAIGGAASSDLASQSAVVRIPREALASLGRWKVRLATGVANKTGDGFAPVTPDLGALAGEPAVYDVAFRTDAQEPLGRDNWWRDKQQALALASSDVSAFSVIVDWSELVRKQTSPEPAPTGWTSRWYFSSIDLGPGIAPNGHYYASDFLPNYLGRRQPYAAYIPKTLTPGTAAPLTMLLHSINVSHNQYAIWNPTFIQNICEARHSICVAPLGRGADLWWADEAELDLWEVWNRIASAYPLDPARTILVGYSMGGYGAYRLGLEHPDLFAAVLPLAGAPACSVRIVEGVEGSAVSGNRECDLESNASPLVENAREVPFYIGHDALDELAPASSAIEQAKGFDALGYRHRLEIYAHQDHVAWSNIGTFEGATAWLHRDERKVAADPSRITYAWYAQHQRDDLGTGPGAVWWVSGLRASSDAPGFRGRIDVTSRALPQGAPAVARSNDAVNNDDGPAAATELTWGPLAPAPEREPSIQVDLTGVATATLDLVRAGLHPGEPAVVNVASDAAALLSLSGLRPGSVVTADDGHSYAVDVLGRVTVTLSAGRTRLGL